MEKMGNRIQIPEIAAAVVAAFFVGRINLFDGTFPAAVAFMIVMLTVSTLYIYLLPVLCGAMMLYIRQGIFVYGDLLAVIVSALFFLFFHRRKYSLSQKTAVGCCIVVLCNVAAYSWMDMLFLLRTETLLKEIIAVGLYMRVFYTLVKAVSQTKEEGLHSRERISLALEIVAVSFVGSLGSYQVVLAVWLFFIACILYYKGIKTACSFAAMTSVYAFCSGETLWSVYAGLFTGIVVAWYGGSVVENRYRKTVTGCILFFCLYSAGDQFIYGCGVAMAVYVAIPSTILLRLGCLIEEYFMPAPWTEKDLQYLAIRKDLQKKRDAFLYLGKLYGTELEGKQIVAYQFMGMARTIEQMLSDLKNKHISPVERPLVPVSVGQASYSFDTVSGDSMAAFALDDHRIGLIISDGMGKGREAAEESKMVVTTLSGLLRAGFDVDLAMKTINGILMTENKEARFATVDLAIIDRRKGRAKIYKMGAATTFMKHDGQVSMLKRQGLPAGITCGLDLEYIDIKLRKGDLLVMVSDGITDCDRKDYQCNWLRSRLLEIGSRDPETVAELVVNKAVEKYGVRERDDLSVITAAIGV